VLNPVPADWSALELVCHARDYAEIFESRIGRALNEDDPQVMSDDNDEMSASREYLSQDVDKVAGVHKAIREMLGQLSKLTDAQWQRTVCHATWGEPTLEWLMNRCAEHQLEHLADIESVRAQLAAFLSGAGACARLWWR
jgi:hypothetical protein